MLHSYVFLGALLVLDANTTKEEPPGRDSCSRRGSLFAAFDLTSGTAHVAWLDAGGRRLEGRVLLGTRDTQPLNRPRAIKRGSLRIGPLIFLNLCVTRDVLK